MIRHRPTFSLLATLSIVALCGEAHAQTSHSPGQLRVQKLSADDVLTVAENLIEARRYEDAQVLLQRLALDDAGGTQREFLEGLVARAQKDYARAENAFRRIIDSDPSLLRVRLELARTLFLAKKDEQADYQFQLAMAAHPPATVLKNVARFRAAIRARRAWRFSVNFGIAPDSNINNATLNDSVDIYGLPFELDEDAKPRSGIGTIVGGDASVRLWRSTSMPIYVAAYGRALRQKDRDFNDLYVGGEAGPELQIAGGRLRITATALKRWYGGDELYTGVGGKASFEKLFGGKWEIEGSLGAKRQAYAGREDTDAWDIDASIVVNRAISATTAGTAYGVVQRSIAEDSAYSNWNARLGIGIVKEIRWGLRPQFSLEFGGQKNDAELGAFGGKRRDWTVRASASLYKRDWNFAGFAPSIKLAYYQTFSTLDLYDQKRLRAELGLTKAF